MKDVFKICPSLPKYTTTWNPDIVLNYFNSLPVYDDLTLKKLSHKLATLLCLLSGQRDQTISKLSINHMALTDDKCTFYVPAILKTTRPGYHQPLIEFPGFPKNEKLCIISTLNVYFKKTETVRKSKQLLVSFKAPHDAVKTTTIGRWCMETMKDAGIDISFYFTLYEVVINKQSSHQRFITHHD